MLEFNKYIKNRLEEFNVEKLERLKKVKFILLSKQNYIVWLFTLDYFLERKSLNVKELYEKVEAYISRQSYFEILSNYEGSNIIKKINYKVDSRQKLIFPSMDAFLEFSEWANFKYTEFEYNNVLKNINKTIS
tara:strand:- start:719 stop:1117 length:399 start_codon:yes stop_codon:yes gene_type:complete